jgi:hypothetical protein
MPIYGARSTRCGRQTQNCYEAVHPDMSAWWRVGVTSALEGGVHALRTSGTSLQLIWEIHVQIDIFHRACSRGA